MRDARERTIRRWLATLDEPRLCEVEALVLRLAIERTRQLLGLYDVERAARERIDSGLRELRDVAPPGNACEWDLSDVEGV